MANNEYVNKVEFGDTTIMDISDTTADAGDVIEGEVFYTKSGARSVGTLGDATQSTHGLMSTTDKTKLDGIDLSLYAPKASPIFSGNASFSNLNQLNGSTGLAVGSYIKVSKNYTITVGTNHEVLGKKSLVGGQYNLTLGDNMFVFGDSLVGINGIVLGKYNVYAGMELPEWQNSTTYTKDDCIQYKGLIYKCKENYTSSNSFTDDTSYWQRISNSTYLSPIFAIGYGSALSGRKNVLSIEENTMYFSGNIYVNCDGTKNKNTEIGGSKVATQSYVTTAISNITFPTYATVATTGSYTDLLDKPTIPDVSGFYTKPSGGIPAADLADTYLTSHQDISGKANSADLATVATSGDYTDLLNKPDLSVYLTSVPTMTGATSSANGTAGLIPAPTSADYEKFFRGDGTWQDGGRPMVILSYGNSTWNDFIEAYNHNVIVYCRASSNSNPKTGTQGRMAFMAYIGFDNSGNPSNVEFQYYRSMNAHSVTAMGDEVYIYKLTSAGAWSVTVRKASIKEIAVASGSKLGVSWSSDKVTLSNTMTADDMPMSSSDATTTKAAIEGLNSNKTNYKEIDVKSYNHNQVTGAEALFSALPASFFGVCYAEFTAGYNAICLVTKSSASYGSITYSVDYNKAPYYYAKNENNIIFSQLALKSDITPENVKNLVTFNLTDDRNRSIIQKIGKLVIAQLHIGGWAAGEGNVITLPSSLSPTGPIGLYFKIYNITTGGLMGEGRVGMIAGETILKYYNVTGTFNTNSVAVIDTFWIVS